MGGPRTVAGGVTHNGMACELKSALDAHGLAAMAGKCCVMHWQERREAGSAVVHSPSLAMARQGSGQAGRDAANFLAACSGRHPHWLQAWGSRAFHLIPCELVATLRHLCWDDKTLTARTPRLPRKWRAITRLPLFRARPALS